MAILVSCPEHPKYKGIRDVRIECPECRVVRALVKYGHLARMTERGAVYLDVRPG